MPRWPVPADVSVVEINGYPIAYQDTGSGAPVVLVHGSLNDYRSWINQVADFNRDHRVLAPSLRHYFPERWDGIDGNFSLAQHADDLAGLIETLRLSKVHLVGHSRGGAVAYMVARDRPELLRSLVLAEPRGLEALLPEGSVGEGQNGNKATFDALHRNIASGRLTEAARAFVDSFNGPGNWDAMPERQKGIILDNIGTAVDSGELPGMTCSDIAGFDFPVLLIRGANSPRRYELGVEAMRRCNPRIAEVVVIPNAAHGMHRANPKAFNDAVLGFWDRIG